MTALNVLLAADEVHFFTDGGNYDRDTLEFLHLGSKLCYLPQYDAVLAWSGPSALGSTLLPTVERSGCEGLWGLCAVLPDLVRGLGVLDRHSVVLAGVAGLAIGVAVEEDGREASLRPGSYVVSLPSDAGFDPDDVRGSGLAMVRSQRMTGLVHGFCLHTVVGADRCSSEVLERWPR